MQPTDYLIGPTESTPDLCLSWPNAQPPTSDGVDWQLGKVNPWNYFHLLIFLSCQVHPSSERCIVSSGLHSLVTLRGHS